MYLLLLPAFVILVFRAFVQLFSKPGESRVEIAENAIRQELSLIRRDIRSLKRKLSKACTCSAELPVTPDKVVTVPDQTPLQPEYSAAESLAVRRKIFALLELLYKLCKLTVVAYVDLETILDAILDISTSAEQHFRFKIRSRERSPLFTRFYAQVRSDVMLDPHDYAVNLYAQFDNSVTEAIYLITEKLDAETATGSEMRPIISAVCVMSVLDFQQRWVQSLEKTPFVPCLQPND